MKLMGKTLCMGLATTAMVVACSSGNHTPTPQPSNGIGTQSPPESIGQLGAQLTLPGGETINTLNYTLTNGTNTYSGSEAVNTATKVSFVITSVAAGSGYALTLTATSADGLYNCTNVIPPNPNVNISVSNRVTTVVNVNMICTSIAGQDAGGVLVNVVSSVCPVWNQIVFNPNNVLDGGNVPNDAGTVAAANADGGSGPIVMTNVGTLTAGQSAVIVGGATAPNPGALVFNWSTTAPAGTLSSPVGQLDMNSTDAGITNEVVFTCPTGQPTTTYGITLTLTDGALPDGGSCPAWETTGTVYVTCGSAAPCGGNPLGTAADTTGAKNLCFTNTGTGPSGTLATPSNGFDWVLPTSDGGGHFCCSLACGGGTISGETEATTYPSGTGGCVAADGGAPLGNNGAGCCLALAPCTASNPTNCVACQDSPSGLCTPTEAVLVQHDILKGVATAPGNDPAGGCYTCLDNNACINGTSAGTGKECADLGGGNFTNGESVSVPAAGTCITALTCMVNTGCPLAGQGTNDAGVALGGVSFCYCGFGGGPLSSCTTPAGGAAANGACFGSMVAGFTHPQTDSTDILGSDFQNITEPTGVADQILICGKTNCKTQCWN